MSDWSAILEEANGTEPEAKSRSKWKPMYDGLIAQMQNRSLADKVRYLVEKKVIPADKEHIAYHAFAAIERRRKKS